MTFPRYMMATKAIHQLGDISRDKEDICRIEAEKGDNYFGSWVTGFGFVNVRFPKESTRELTPLEKQILILAVQNAELRLALEEIDAVAVSKKAGAAKKMQEIARRALTSGQGT